MIDLALDFEIAIRITHPRTGDVRAGLTGITAWVSATRGGTAIHASLSTTLTEDSEEPGTYTATLNQTDVSAQLATYANKQVFVVINKTGDIYRKSFGHIVMPLNA